MYSQCIDPNLYADNCDFDGDGILNGDDLDDDNDGILDTNECPAGNLLSSKEFIGLGFPPNIGTATLRVEVAGLPGTNVTIDGTAYVIPASGLLQTTVNKINAVSGINANQIFDVIASENVTVTLTNDQPFTTDGWAALPSSALSTDYTIIGYPNDINAEAQILISSATQIANVSILNALGVTQATFTLDPANDEAFLYTEFADLTGYKVISDVPVNVTSGSKCLDTGPGFCDYVNEQLFPDGTQSTEYFIPDIQQPFDTRIVSLVNGTEIFVDGISQGIFNQGQFLNLTVTGAHVTSTNPVTAYMVAFGGPIPGDPSFILLPGANNAVNEATFAAGNASFLNHDVTIIAATADVGLIMLDGAAVGGTWIPFADDPSISYQVVPVSQGVHTVTSTSAFIPIYYGEQNYESNGYAAGFGSSEIGSYSEGGSELQDTDEDSIPNCFDLDSDDDGCPDAIEGGSNFIATDINGNTMLVGGVDPSNGIPLAAGAGQSVQFSIDDSIQGDGCACELNDPNADCDFDGVINFFDCDPQNPSNNNTSFENNCSEPIKIFNFGN